MYATVLPPIAEPKRFGAGVGSTSIGAAAVAASNTITAVPQPIVTREKTILLPLMSESRSLAEDPIGIAAPVLVAKL